MCIRDRYMGSQLTGMDDGDEEAIRYYPTGFSGKEHKTYGQGQSPTEETTAASQTLTLNMIVPGEKKTNPVGKPVMVPVKKTLKISPYKCTSFVLNAGAYYTISNGEFLGPSDRPGESKRLPILFGRVNMSEPPQICVRDDHTEVARKQGEITYDSEEDRYFLTCLGRTNPAYVMLEENEEYGLWDDSVVELSRGAAKFSLKGDTIVFFESSFQDLNGKDKAMENINTGLALDGTRFVLHKDKETKLGCGIDCDVRFTRVKPVGEQTFSPDVHCAIKWNGEKFYIRNVGPPTYPVYIWLKTLGQYVGQKDSSPRELTHKLKIGVFNVRFIVEVL
eukprot:TRINITY_DN3871_c0_g1_i1.p1 TRINITY_DN3871_c0_g1~~TRINITY_DN3871_c0_g1_i1.p1  ORF type:complete len:334 (-),score=23.18 TRINITY_DN3871_c0_g1_i1:169-1170(-)